jgi:hypothetical protein
MVRAKVVVSVFGLLAIVGASYWIQRAGAASCDAIVGRWSWFVGGDVTISPGGSFVQQSGNGGTWQCADAASGKVTLRWAQGEFVNQVAVSADGNQLTSTDPSQSYVTAKRIGAAPASAGQSSAPVVSLSTEKDGARDLPKDLPKLLHAVMQQARAWSKDAIPVALEVKDRAGSPNPRMRGPEVRISFLSPSSGTGLFAFVAADDGLHTTPVSKPVGWSTESLPPLFLDLPVAVRVAREDGGNGGGRNGGSARLQVWNPTGNAPVVAWMVGDRTVNGVTGEIIRFDVTGYEERYNADWTRASEGLRALFQHARSSKVDSWGDTWSPYDFCQGNTEAMMCQGIQVPPR